MSEQSRFESAQKDIMNEFAQITKANGYRTDVAHVYRAHRSFDQIKQNEIGVVIATGEVSGLDQVWTSFDSIRDVLVQGVVFANANTTPDAVTLNEAVSGLEKDILQVIALMMTKNISGTDKRWNIMPKPFVIATGVDFGQGGTQSVVRIIFQIQLRSMDGTFS